VGLNLQVASNIVLAELSWTDAEQTQAIDRSHRIGQAEPVTAWRIIAPLCFITVVDVQPKPAGEHGSQSGFASAGPAADPSDMSEAGA
jgi:hypothetical protein